MKKLVMVLVMLAVLVTPAAVLAQAGPFGQFCSGELALPGALTTKPAENPCSEQGAFVYVDGGSIVMFSGYEEFLGHSGQPSGNYYFIPGMVTTADPQDPPSGDPSVWTEAVCEGAAAAVYQGEEEKGDGVTLSPLNPLGCETDSTWFVVEPWGEVENPDTGCLAYSWDEVGEFAERMNWLNGSAWKRYVDVDEEFLTEHPLVVDCSDVISPDSLGLNPYEDQVRPSRLPWVYARADELLNEAGLTWEEFCTSEEWTQNSDYHLIPLLCAQKGFTVTLPEREPIEEPEG